MSRELADITIQLNDLEDVVYDELIEFLEDQKIKYVVAKVENRRTEYSEEEKDSHEEYENELLEKGINVYDW